MGGVSKFWLVRPQTRLNTNSVLLPHAVHYPLGTNIETQSDLTMMPCLRLSIAEP